MSKKLFYSDKYVSFTKCIAGLITLFWHRIALSTALFEPLVFHNPLNLGL